MQGDLPVMLCFDQINLRPILLKSIRPMGTSHLVTKGGRVETAINPTTTPTNLPRAGFVLAGLMLTAMRAQLNFKQKVACLVLMC